MADTISTNLDMWCKIYGTKEVAAQLRQIAHPIKTLSNTIKDWTWGDSAPLSADDRAKRLEQLGKMADKIDPKLKSFNMNWLSIMFTGMQVWRLFKGLFDSMIQTMDKLGGKFHPVNIAITRMAVSWEILKYTLMNALAPIILKVVEEFAQLVERFQDMDPAFIEGIADAILLLGAVGLAAFTSSQVALFAQAVENLWKIGTKEGLATTIGNIAAAVLKLSGLAAGFYLVFKGFQKWQSGDIVGTLVEAVGALGFFALAAGATAIAAPVLAVYAVIKIIQALWEGKTTFLEAVVTALAAGIGAGGLALMAGATATTVGLIGGMVAISAFILLMGIKWSGDAEQAAKDVQAKLRADTMLPNYKYAAPIDMRIGELLNEKVKLERESWYAWGSHQKSIDRRLEQINAEITALETQKAKLQQQSVINADNLNTLDNVDKKYGSIGQSVNLLSQGPMVNLTGSIDVAGMSATQLNNELSKEVHKTIYIHVVKTGGNSSNNPYGGGAWGGGFSGTINGRNQFAMGGGARVISSSNQ